MGIESLHMELEEREVAEAYAQYLLSFNSHVIEALENIAVTAQAASQHEPEQFCEWAFNAATEALAKSEKHVMSEDEFYEYYTEKKQAREDGGREGMGA